ncbi:Endonuclease III like protein [Verticillium longisporum]|nr:Endonuclease III like protein [Verticillium longisporum]
MTSKLPGSGPHVYVLLWRDCGGNEFVALGAYAHLKDANAEAKRLGKEQLSDGLTYSSMQADLKTQDSEPLRSLARFAFHDSTVPSSSPTLATAPLTPDIEDGLEANPRKRRRVATKVEPVIKAPPSPDSKPPSESPRKRRKPARVSKGESPSGDTVEGPSDWEEMYELVRQMRLCGPARDAAVDTMGCERLFSPTASDRDRRFQILISLMMSSQTKDTVNAVAMGRLHDELPPHEAGAPPGLNLENILAVEPAKLNELIRVVGFHNNKTKFIKQAALLLRDNFDADIPPTIDGLTSLPGVGPKMAHLCLSAAWGRTEGIGVDVHSLVDGDGDDFRYGAAAASTCSPAHAGFPEEGVLWWWLLDLHAADHLCPLGLELRCVALVAYVFKAGALVILQKSVLATEVALAEAAVANDALSGITAVLGAVLPPCLLTLTPHMASTVTPLPGAGLPCACLAWSGGRGAATTSKTRRATGFQLTRQTMRCRKRFNHGCGIAFPNFFVL